MGTSTPKQFLKLKEKPILMHTVERLFDFDNNAHFIIALPFSEFDYWHQLCKNHNFELSHQLSKGGVNRFESVKNALNKVTEKSIVCIHDGVRPLVKKDVITRCINTAKKTGCAIPVLPIEESIREVSEQSSRVVDRNKYKCVQTPQCFSSELILKAYQQDYKSMFTDDASVVESMGINMSLVEGNKENIKITTPEDLVMAEFLLKQFD